MIVIFYSSLHLLGFFCLLPFSKRIPVWFMALTGFVWGLLLWVFASLLTLLVGLPFAWWSVCLMIFPVLAAAIYYSIRNQALLTLKRYWLLVLGCLLVIMAVSYLIIDPYYVYTTTDSFNYIYHGKVLARSGLVSWGINNFTKLGAISSLIQMSSHLLNVEFLSGYQTILGLQLILLLVIDTHKRLLKNTRPLIAIVLALVIATILGSDTFFDHLFYIHSNLSAGVFLLLALYCFRHYFHSDALEWSLLGMFAMLGFSFSRIEGPLYSTVILMLVLSIKPSGKKGALSIALPYSAAALAWHLFLIQNVLKNEQLSQSNLLIIMAALVGLVGFTVLVSWRPGIFSGFPELLLGLMGSGVILLILLEPGHMVASITHFWQNLTNIYFWSWTWLIVLANLPILVQNNQNQPGSRLLLYAIGGYILVVLLVVIARIPYRLGQSDSANRLMLQLLPTILYLISIKFEQLLPFNQKSQ